MLKIPSNRSLIGMAVGTLILASTPALAAQWIPGHYGASGHFHPGHWVGTPDVWISGYYGPNGYFHPGHWAGGYGPPPGPYEGPPPGVVVYGQHWVPGFYGPTGYWHRGHWAG